MAWFSVHDGTFCDAKWPVIARKASTNVGSVVAIWISLLDHASQASPRGSISGFDPETIDALYGYEDGVCQRVLDAMREKGLVDCEEIVNWGKRQPSGKSEKGKSATERSREYRERKKAMQRDATDCNGLRIDKNREEKKILKPSPLPPRGGTDGEPPAPDFEFVQLRDIWDTHMRAEGSRAGFKAYLSLKKNRAWPGIGVIQHDVMRRKQVGVWTAGYEPGLERYLSDRTWEGALPKARAAPAAPTEYQQRKQESRELARMVLQQENQHAELEIAAAAALDQSQPGLPGAILR